MSNARYARARGRAAGHACTAGYQRQALDLVARGASIDPAATEVGRLDARLRKLGRRWSLAVRRTSGCDCGSPLFAWEALAGQPLTVRPLHFDGCRATKGLPVALVLEGAPMLPRLADDPSTRRQGLDQ